MNFCWCCLLSSDKQLGQFNSQPLIYDEKDVQPLEAYEKCSNVVLQITPALMEQIHICDSCVLQLERAYFFLEMCRNNFLTLKNSLEPSNCCWCCAATTEESDFDKMIDKMITISSVPVRILDAYHELNFGELSNDENVKICDLCTIQLESFLNFRRICQASNMTTIGNSIKSSTASQIIEIDLSDDESPAPATEIEISDDDCSDDNFTSTCDICSDTFSSRSLLKVHTEMHAKAFSLLENEIQEPATKVLTELKQKKGKKKCNLCPLRVDSQLELSKHMLSHKVPRYACKLCDKSFLKAQSLWEHAFIHKGFAPYECGECSKEFRILTCFNLHLKEHNIKYDDRIHGYHKESFQQILNFIMK